jgi:hypothetical protein
MSALETISPTCLFCGNPLRGRIDKKFCDAGCKNGHSNRLQREERAAIRPIDAILKHNRRVLKRCLGADHSRVVAMAELVHSGFRTDYYTHYFINQYSDQYVFCYDYGYLALPDDRYLIVRNKGTIHHGVPPLFCS